MSRPRGELEVAYDILDALQHGPLVQNRLFCKARLNTVQSREHLVPLVDKGFVEDWHEPKASGFKGWRVEDAIARGAPPVNKTKHPYKITPKGMALLLLIHQAKVMLGG